MPLVTRHHIDLVAFHHARQTDLGLRGYDSGPQLLSTGQNLQGPQKRLELFGEVQDDVAEKVESVAEQGLEWPLECFFNRMGCCS